MALVLEGRGLTLERDHRVLFSKLDIAISQGELAQVVGPNGAGKTTLLRALLGLNGLLQGPWQWHAPYGEDQSIEGDRLLYIGHKSGMSHQLTAIENLHYQSQLRGQIVNHDSMLEALMAVGLRGYDETRVAQMSAGQQRRVALAQLFLPQSQCLWVLDEPFTALDVAGVKKLEERMMEFCDHGGTVMFTSHQTPLLFSPSIIELVRPSRGHQSI